MSDYRRLLDLTSDTLVRRSRGFRNLVVGVVAIGLCACIGALVVLSLRPLSILLLLVPAHALFVWRDNRILADWRLVLADAWQGRTIDFSAFAQALKANKALPPATVAGMLDTLPTAGDLAAERRLSAGTRAAIVQAMRVRDTCHTGSLACRAAGLVCIPLAIVSALLLRSALPLLAGAAVPALAWACVWSRRSRLNRAVGRILGLLGAADCNVLQYRECLTALAWGRDARQDRGRLIDLGP
jgi:hypothetical protein